MNHFKGKACDEYVIKLILNVSINYYEFFLDVQNKFTPTGLSEHYFDELHNYDIINLMFQ